MYNKKIEQPSSPDRNYSNYRPFSGDEKPIKVILNTSGSPNLKKSTISSKIYLQNEEDEIPIIKSNVSSTIKKNRDMEFDNISHQIELPQILIESKKESNINMPISIFNRSNREGPIEIYDGVKFNYNEEMNLLSDFSQIDWLHYDKSDFLSFLKSKKLTIKDFLKYYKNNYQTTSFLKNTNNEDKIIEIINIDAHHGAIKTVVITPDLSKIISAGYDQTIKVWNSSNYNLLSTFSGHEGTITCLYACSDNLRLISGSQDCSIRIWNMDTNIEEKTFINIHNDDITKVMLNFQQNRLISASKDSTIKIIDLYAERVITSFDYHSKSVNDLYLSDDEKYLISCSSDTTIKILENYINKINFSKNVKILDGHTASVLKFEVTEIYNRAKIVSLGEDSQIIIWDLELKIKELIISNNINQINTMLLIHEKKLMITSNLKNTLQIWNLLNGKELSRKEIREDKGIITSMSYLNKNKKNQSIQIITGSHDKYLKVWNLKDLNEFDLIYSSNVPILCLKITSDNRYIIFSITNLILIFDRSTNKIEKTLHGHKEDVTVLVLASNSKVLLSGSKDSSIRIWNLESSLHEEILQKHEAGIISIAISEDMNNFASSSNDFTVRIWNFQRKEEIFCLRDMGIVNCMCFGNNKLFIGSNDGVIKCWNYINNKQINVFRGHALAISGIEFSKLNNNLITVSFDKTIKLWDLETFEMMRIYYNKDEIIDVKLSIEELDIIIFDKKNNVKVISIDTMTEEKVLPINDSIIKSIGISNDSKDIFFGFENGDLKVWHWYDVEHTQIFYADQILSNIHEEDYDSIKEIVKPRFWKSIFNEFIYPCKCSLIHYYAYNNEIDKIKRIFKMIFILNETQIILNKDIFNRTMIDVVLAQNNKHLIYFLLEILIRYPPPVNCFPNITETIYKASLLNYPHIHKLLDSRILPINQVPVYPNDYYQKDGISYVSKMNKPFLVESKNFDDTRLVTYNTSLITLPEYLYFHKLIDEPKEGEIKNYSKIDVLDVPNLFGNDERSHTFINNIICQNNISIFHSKAIQYYIKFKWDEYASKIFFIRFLFYFFVVLMLIVYSVWLLPIRLIKIGDINNMEAFGMVNFIFNCVLGFFAYIFWMFELYKLFGYGFKHYLYNFENIYFFVNLLLFLAVIVFDFIGSFNIFFDEDVIRCLHAFNLYFFILGLFFFARGFQSGFIINFIIKVLFNIKVLLLSFVFVIYAFGFVIFIFDKKWDLKNNISDKLTTVFWKQQFMTFDIVYRILIKDYSLFNNETNSIYELIVWVFFLISTFLLILILINALIATMIYFFKEMNKNKQLYFYKQKLQLIYEIDKVVNARVKNIFGKRNNFKKYLLISKIFIDEFEKNENMNNIKDYEINKILKDKFREYEIRNFMKKNEYNESENSSILKEHNTIYKSSKYQTYN